MAKEKNLTTVSSLAESDYVRAVTSAGASVKASVENLGKAVMAYSTGTVTAGSDISTKGYTILRSVLSKTGPIVILQVTFSWTSSANSDVNLLTLPSGFRPAEQLQGRQTTSTTINWTISTAGVLNVASPTSITTGGNERLYIVFATNS